MSKSKTAAEKPTRPAAKVVSANPAKLAGSPDLAWTHTLLNQTLGTLWTKHSDAKQRDEQIDAMLAGKRRRDDCAYGSFQRVHMSGVTRDRDVSLGERVFKVAL